MILCSCINGCRNPGSAICRINEWQKRNANANSQNEDGAKTLSPSISDLIEQFGLCHLKYTPASEPKYETWTERFLNHAKLVSTWSKDPSTKVGAVIYRNRRCLSEGYNGFAPGVPDHPDLYNDRAQKYPRAIHAELNALLFAIEPDLSGSQMYVWGLPPCPQCAACIIAKGINHVHCAAPHVVDKLLERYHEWNFEITLEQFAQAGVKVTVHEEI